ncbi:carcinoembryonic antigen-related cell adhesion molecule 1-like [Stegostoma tigrinum]|uniref:carcinoembryonic antigen-related cell adhesion molecule 1-like n=1 Tax=Stegostoma tigrinum TaxID=3053191 RepID=UPI00202B04EA|nr:carcinoembryonic antigen-related cell adhesion molecule 1-like [Stegostoma tigrinum]XP_048398456.1 carcinoembryonic antigen-related cell adhesion molecule 1-like [Stegostoma tigrinum]XP_048398457.1 carcinoembryonic antigen-related cell adhesion molecule 1-like [Stegostoma tigrinum]XP_059506845.1 carcinoembryonic antigen-related cell adhesion molecule 1-like [Stegostoma tigrinum]
MENKKKIHRIQHSQEIINMKMLTLLSAFSLLTVFGTEISALSVINATVGEQVLFPVATACSNKCEVAFLSKSPIHATLASGGITQYFIHILYKDRLQFATNCSLVLQNVQINDSKSYAIQIDCHEPSTVTEETLFQLQVFEPVSKPSITINCSTTNVSLSCSVSNGTNVTLHWEKKSLSGAISRINDRAELVLNHDHEQNQNEYMCVAENPVSRETSDPQKPEQCNSKGWQRPVFIGTATVLFLGLVIIIIICFKTKPAACDKGNNVAIGKWNEETCYLNQREIEAAYITRVEAKHFPLSAQYY